MERKKIVPKAKFDAAKQEELLRKLQQNTEEAVNFNTFTATTVNEPAPTPVVREETINLQQVTVTAVNISKKTETAERSGKIQRITVDMPIDLYERMKGEVENNGQTIKGFIVNLVRAHFKKSE
jgi:tRNA uridine 5-carbamoylmethylation protein Kti12